VVDVGDRPAAASDIDTSGSSLQRSHVALPGDTLWSIADRYRGDVGRDRYIDALIDLNGGTRILAGQAIRLP
jgi:Tfp pilus assembly protein FimV